MEAKINIANLLKDCPKGMELNCTMYDSVTLLNVNDREDITFPIKVLREDGHYIPLTKYGQYTYADFAKCVIYPKGKTTWEGFQRPFMDGDIVTWKDSMGSLVACIYKERKNTASFNYHIALYKGGLGIIVNGEIVLTNDELRLATTEEKEKLFQAIKDNGYYWNPETKTLEKLPKFKVGDKIKHKDSGIYCTLGEYSEGISAYRTDIGGLSITYKDMEQWELAPNKFDIDTLVPFESRVLVRDNADGVWLPCFFGGICNSDNNYPYRIVGGERWKCCIPYEGNEHLLGKTDDCDEYYKTWE